MRQRFPLACASLAVVAALAGCGGGSSGASATDAAGVAASPTSGSGALSSGAVTTGAITSGAVNGGAATNGAVTSGSTTTSASTNGSGASSGGTATASTPTGTSTAPAGTSSAARLAVGVNLHTGGGTTAANGQIASIMSSRNLAQARLDYFANTDTTLLRDQIAKINANGGKVQLAVQNSYQWDYSCNQNLSAVEQDAYNQTLQMVGAMKDIAHDYEILNEIQLRSDVGGQVSWNSQGGSTTAYNNSTCAHTLATVARGMSRAIHDQGQRVILGEVGRDFGFLTFMAQQGVTWDVTGFHIYPHAGDTSLLSDTWYGAGGPLAQLATFGKPVTINEFNCGEIYDSGYENQAGMPVTETCMKSVTRHMTDLRAQKIANLESVVVYELLDEPGKAAPENRFGLMSTLGNPKPELFLVTAFAGGTLTTAEQQAITSRGLLSDAQIAAMK